MSGTSVVPRSRQAEEQLLQRLFVDGRRLTGGGRRQAVAQLGAEQLEPGAVQRPGGGDELRDDVAAVAASFDHADDAADLALHPAKSGYHLGRHRVLTRSGRPRRSAGRAGNVVLRHGRSSLWYGTVVRDVVVRTSSAAHYPPPPSWRPGGGCGFWTFTPQGTVWGGVGVPADVLTRPKRWNP